MSQETAMQAIETFRERLYALVRVASISELEIQWEIIRNDIDEWIGAAFERESRDYQEINRILHPMAISIGPSNPYLEVSTDSDRLLRAFALVEHRLKQGQARLLQLTPDEHLIEAGTPHSAYVLLRIIIESASRLVFLVDPYVDRTLFPLLSNAPAGVEIRILTRQAKTPADFVTEATKFIHQTSANLDCRAGLDDFHDRFLVVDDKLFFSGASFKDLGKKASVVAKVEDVKTQTITELEARWNCATPLS